MRTLKKIGSILLDAPKGMLFIITAFGGALCKIFGLVENSSKMGIKTLSQIQGRLEMADDVPIKRVYTKKH